MAINNQYSGKNIHQVWDEWIPRQREHFLRDHNFDVDRELWGGMSYNKLFSYLKPFIQDGENYLDKFTDAMAVHIVDGQYSKGGGIKGFFNKAKKIGSKGYDFTKKHASAGYEKTKEFAKEKIHNERKKIALRVLDETEDKVSGKYKKVLSNAGDIVVEEYAKGGKIGKFKEGDEVMVNDSGYVKYFSGFDVSKPATIRKVEKTKQGFFYGLTLANGDKPFNNAPESKLTLASEYATGGIIKSVQDFFTGTTSLKEIFN